MYLIFCDQWENAIDRALGAGWMVGRAGDAQGMYEYVRGSRWNGFGLQLPGDHDGRRANKTIV